MVERRITTPDQPVMRCSFCNKAQADGVRLIAGPNVYICNECVQVCNEIMRADNESSPSALDSAQSDALVVEPPPASRSTHPTTVVICKLCGLPLPWEDALVVPERGVLCPGCSGEVEASLAQKRENAT